MASLFDFLSNKRSPQQKLEDAILTSNFEELKGLLEEGVDPNTKLHKFGGDRAIHLAATRGNALMIEWLISAGAVCDLPNDSGITPLYNAFRANQCQALEMLLKHCKLDKRLNYMWVEGLNVERKISENYAIQAVQIISAPNLLLQAHHLRSTYWDVLFTMNLSSMVLTVSHSFMNYKNIKLLFLTGFKTPDSLFLTYKKKVVEKLENLQNNVQWFELTEVDQEKVVDALKDITEMLTNMKKNPLSLRHLCRLVIRFSFWNKCNVFYGTDRLPLPNQLKKFILFDE